MKIKTILSQNRRDFEAIYECENCSHEMKGHGYDDSYFHDIVIPDMVCPQCNCKAGSDYRPLKPKYDDAITI